ncbi:MAG TPA: hypothetical protein VHP83_19315 [Aggregatilineaceae bacterium]|nr:hypothetical protein [Aggregatilineaceae bacterium]
MFKKVFLLIALGLMLLLPSGPLSAQDGPDPELVAYVVGAFEQLNAVESYGVSGYQATVMELVIKANEIEVTAESTFDAQFQPTTGGNIKAAVATVNGDVEVSTDGDGASMSVTAEVIFIDLKQYFRLDIDAPAEAGLDVPYEWYVIDMSELAGITEEAGIDFDVLAQTTGNKFLSDLYIPITSDAVQAIREEAPEVLDGREYRVFSVTISPEGTIPDELGKILDVAELQAQIEAAEGGANSDTALLANIDQLMDAMTITEDIWIDAETGLPLHVILEADYSEMLPLMGQIDPELAGVTGSLEKFSDVTIDNINAPFSVELPADATSLPASAMIDQ